VFGWFYVPYPREQPAGRKHGREGRPANASEIKTSKPGDDAARKKNKKKRAKRS
jgi:hypothetical protein